MIMMKADETFLINRPLKMSKATIPLRDRAGRIEYFFPCRKLVQCTQAWPSGAHSHLHTFMWSSTPASSMPTICQGSYCAMAIFQVALRCLLHSAASFTIVLWVRASWFNICEIIEIETSTSWAIHSLSWISWRKRPGSANSMDLT